MKETFNVVLRGARERDVAGDAPGALARDVLGLRILGDIFFDTTAADVLEFEHELVLLLVESVRIVDKAVGIGERDHLGTQAHGLLGGVLGHVAGAGHDHRLALEALLAGREHLLREVADTVAGGLRAEQAAAPVETLAGQRARELVAEALVLAEEE